MFISWWGLFIMAVLYVYLIITDIRLHNRVKRLERVIKEIEGEYEESKTNGGGNGNW